MESVLSGHATGASAFKRYLEAFHTQTPSVTSFVFERLRRSDGRTTYEYLAQAVAEGRARSVLDVGCGDGALLSTVRSLLPSSRLAGIDVVASELDLARANVSNAEIVQADAAELPFADGSFDAVTSHLVLMLFPHAMDAMREVRRVLAPEGRFAFIVPDVSYNDEQMTAVQESVRRTVVAEHPHFKPFVPADSRIFSRDGITEMLKGAGFNGAPEFAEFAAAAAVDTRGALEILQRRYYIGSLGSELVEKIGEALDKDFESQIVFKEGLRAVFITR